MKSKVLVPLIILCIALVISVMTRRSNEPTTSLIEQVEFISLLDASVDTSQVTRLEIFAGVSPKQRLSMVHENDEWRMASFHNALIKSQRPLKILEAVKEFKGEFRAEATEEQLADYDLSNNRALHIRGLIGDTGDVAFHILAGKTPKPGTIFMRNIHSNTIYLVNHNIRQGAFMKSTEYDEIPSPNPWFDLSIISEPDAQFSKLEITMPDKNLAFEKRTVESDDENAPVSEWVLTEGGLEKSINPKALESLELTLKSLEAFQVISPEKRAIWGLDDPKYRIRAHRENGDPIELVLSQPAPNNPGYVQRMDNGNQSLYAIASLFTYTLFLKGEALYDLPKLDVGKDTLRQIAYSTPDEHIELNRENDVWTLKGAENDAVLNQNTVAKMRRSLESWQAVDYADPTTETGLEESASQVTFKSDSAQHSLVVGNESSHIKGRYAHLDTQAEHWVMSERDFKRIFLSKETLCTEDDPDAEKKPKTMSFPGFGQPGTHAPEDGHNHDH